MAALATHVVPNLGLRVDNVSGTPNIGGDDCATGAGVFLLVQNTDPAPRGVTLVTPGVVDGDLPIGDRTFTIPATTGMYVIPVPDNPYRNKATGRAAITYPDGITGLSVRVIRVAAS